MLADKPLKIAYLSSNDPTDKKVWSGTHYSIYSCLKKLPAEVTILGPYEPKTVTFIGKIMTGLSQLLFKKRYNYRHSKLLAKAYGNFFNKKLELVILTPKSHTKRINLFCDIKLRCKT